MATGHIVTGSPARAVARVARARGARVVIFDQPGPSHRGQPAVGLMAELRRRMYGSGIVVLAETDRRGGWVSA
jgi:phosphoglycerate dehydrogenase-like enzyme